MSSASKWKRHWSSLPITRVQNIMKSAPGVQNITPDAVAVATRFGELFIAGFCKEAYEWKMKDEKDPSQLTYKDLTAVVHGDGEKEGAEQYAFLQEIIPRKITVKEYWETIAKEGGDPGSPEQNVIDTEDDEEEKNDDGADENGDAGEMDAEGDVDAEEEEIEDEDEDEDQDQEEDIEEDAD